MGVLQNSPDATHLLTYLSNIFFKFALNLSIFLFRLVFCVPCLRHSSLCQWHKDSLPYFLSICFMHKGHLQPSLYGIRQGLSFWGVFFCLFVFGFGFGFWPFGSPTVPVQFHIFPNNLDDHLRHAVRLIS